VLQNAKKKSFGLFGGSLARVKASMEVEDVAEPVAEEKPVKKAKKEVAEKVEVKTETKEVKGVPFSELKDGTPEKKAAAYLISILENLGCKNLQLVVNPIDGGSEITVEGEGLGVMIGHRGETLDAIQHLTSLSANVGEGGYYRIILNTGDYRQRREQTLINLAKRMSQQALKAGKCRTLEPMNPYERRIIHTTVQEIKGAKSSSVGEGADRKVVISLEEGFKPTGDRYNRGGRGRYNNRGGYKKDGGRRYPSKDRKFEAAPSAEVSEPREPRSDLNGAFLYGKIDVE